MVIGLDGNDVGSMESFQISYDKNSKSL